jgi:hypothetical protein
VLAAISCRREHVEDAVGSYHPPLNDRGEPIERSGYHVPCQTDLDCANRCGFHPISGTRYACTKNVQLYSYAGYDRGAFLRIEEEAKAAAAANERHAMPWVPEPRDENFYLIDEPGAVCDLRIQPPAPTGAHPRAPLRCAGQV